MTPAGLTGNQPYQQIPPAHTPSHKDVDKLQSQLLNEPSPATRDTQGKTKKGAHSRSVTSGVRASAEEQSPGYKKEEGGYQCDHCDRRSTFLCNAKRHLRSHTGETPYECKHCDKKFKQSHHLKRHLRIHTREKPYQCEYCGKKFNRPDNLKTHLRTHTGEKPYKCEHCEFFAANKRGFNYHMTTRHQAPPDTAKRDAPPAKKIPNSSVLPRSDLKKDNA